MAQIKAAEENNAELLQKSRRKQTKTLLYRNIYAKTCKSLKELA